MFSTIMMACSTLISVYTILLILRIMMSWFRGSVSQSKAGRILARITDPYLAFFRRFKFCRIGYLDFSPVLALIFLSVAGNVFLSLAAFQKITVGLVLAFLLSSVWDALAFFIGMYIFLAVLRIFGLFLRLNSASPFWRYVDMILGPVLRPITRLAFRGRPVPYMQALVATALFLLALRLLGAFIINRLVVLLQRIPF